MSQFDGEELIFKKCNDLKINHSKIIATYVWIDGSGENLRSKSRTLSNEQCDCLNNLPRWSYDGSSTQQATTDDSEIFLKPVAFYRDPFFRGNNLLVLCETFIDHNNPTSTNRRYALTEMYPKVRILEPALGIEQEYVLFGIDKRPLGWPKVGEPVPQGPYYCSVGADRAFGRRIVDAHYKACLHAGISIEGTNAEVMPAQWEFQIGHGDALKMCDDLWMARYILHRIAEENGAVVSFSPKPMEGDWNGSGAHFNFSTVKTTHDNGMKKLQHYIRKLEKAHRDHMVMYDPNGGTDNKKRLNGRHETSSFNTFTSGVGSRNVSVRIPKQVAQKGYGYFEDRRPAANADPYSVAFMLIATCLNPSYD